MHEPAELPFKQPERSSEVQTGEAKPSKAARFDKGHQETQSLSPPSSFLINASNATAEGHECHHVFLFLPQVCGYWKTPQVPHSLSKTTLKGIRSREKNGGRKRLFSISPLPPMPGQAFPRCTLRPLFLHTLSSGAFLCSPELQPALTV